MKAKQERSRIWPVALFFLMVAGEFSLTGAAEEQPLLEKKLEEARFQQEGTVDGPQQIVGWMSLRRQFLGTRVEPNFQDTVQFHFYNGDRLRLLRFEDTKMETELLKKLANGHPFPVLAAVRCESKILGHDGINMSKVLLARLESYEQVDIDAVCSVAEEAGFEKSQSVRFRKALQPDYEKNGIVVRLGKVTAHSKVAPRGAALGIEGIQIFNANSEALTCELLTVEVKQGGNSQLATLRNAEKQPGRWQVDGQSWTNGLYQPGKMPVVLRMFDLAEPLLAGEQVTLEVKMKLSTGEGLVLSKAVEVL